MPRYKLTNLGKGDHLYCEGSIEFVADTANEARDMFLDEGYDLDEVRFLTSKLVHPFACTKKMIDNEDVHWYVDDPEEAYPGQTLYDTTTDDGREIDYSKPGPRRVWERGSWRPWTCVDNGIHAWKNNTVPAKYLKPGINVEHDRHGKGKTTSGDLKLTCGRRWLEVEFESGKTLVCSTGTIATYATARPREKYGYSNHQLHWPPGAAFVAEPGRKGTAERGGPDDYVAYGYDEGCLQALADIRADRLQWEWEAEQVRTGQAP